MSGEQWSKTFDAGLARIQLALAEFRAEMAESERRVAEAVAEDKEADRDKR